MSSYQDLPWPEDEHATGTTQKAYFRTWKGMPLRNEWNAAPFRKGCQTCKRCGYKWDQMDFTYKSGVIVNGQPEPMAIHDTCWNCWMCDTNHAQVRTFWEAADRQNTPPQAAKGPKTGLKPIGGAL